MADDPSIQCPPLPLPCQWTTNSMPAQQTDDAGKVTLTKLVYFRLATVGGAVTVLLHPADARNIAAQLGAEATKAESGLDVVSNIGGLVRP